MCEYCNFKDSVPKAITHGNRNTRVVVHHELQYKMLEGDYKDNWYFDSNIYFSNPYNNNI